MTSNIYILNILFFIFYKWYKEEEEFELNTSVKK